MSSRQSTPDALCGFVTSLRKQKKSRSLKVFERTSDLPDRYTEIERENRILLEKMTNIMQNRGAYSAPYQKKSLNREHRKRELLRITLENQVSFDSVTVQAILRRLQDKTSNYSVARWEDEAVGRQRILTNICEYPYTLQDKRGIKATTAYMERRPDSTNPMSSEGFAQMRAKLPKGFAKQADDLDENRVVFYKKGKQLGNGYYIVEISSNNAYADSAHMQAPFHCGIRRREPRELLDRPAREKGAGSVARVQQQLRANG